MNVLCVISRLDFNDNALDTREICRYLVLNGHKAVIASPEGRLVKQIDQLGIRHYNLKCTNPFSVISSMWKLKNILSGENIDIIHAMDKISCLISFFASRLSEVPYVSTIYHYPKGWILGRFQLWAKSLLCFNKSIYRFIIEDRFFSPSKLYLVSPLVDISQCRTIKTDTNKDFSIIAYISFSFYEDAQDFVKSIRLIFKSISHLQITVLYSVHPKSEMLARFKLLIKRHFLEEFVKFVHIGEVRNELFSKASIFVNTSTDLSTGFRYILKALISGIPVITQNIQSLESYLVDDLTCVFYRKGDIQNLASKILNLYKDSGLRNRLINGAKNYIEKHLNLKDSCRRIVEVYKKILSSKEILIIKTGAVGDAILITPSIKAIKMKFPYAKIKVLTSVECRDIFINNRYIDDIIIYDSKARDKGIKGLLRTAARLRLEQFDMIIDLQNNKKSHLLAFLSLAPKRYGYDNGKMGFLLNRKLRCKKEPVDPVNHQLRLLRLLGIYSIDRHLDIQYSREDQKWVDAILSSHWISDNAKLIAFNLVASRKWISKNWPIMYYMQLGEKLVRELKVRIVLIGNDRNSSAVKTFLKRTKIKPIDTIGQTDIPRLAALLKRCHLLITPDSAPMHVAASVDTPFIAFFGPTDSRRHLPPAQKFKVLRKELKCSPCYNRYCDMGYICMKSIKPDEVYQLVKELVDQ